MLKEYQTLKRKLYSRLGELEVPAERLKIIVAWLWESKVDELLEAAKMLESNADYIIDQAESPKEKYDIFLSHVQKNSTDISRNVKDSLEKKGMRVWFDKSAEKPDKYGIIDGVINSTRFLIMLTKDYFLRPFCIFEYCISVVVAKTTIAVYEPNPNHGRGHLTDFVIPEQFKPILNNDFLEVNRTYWGAFITKLFERIKETEELKRAKSLSVIDNKSKVLTKVQRSWLDHELRQEGRIIGIKLFTASVDGNTSAAFHRKCDGQGATLTVIETSKRKIFGGFTSTSWASSGGSSSADSVWLFKQDEEGAFERIDIRQEKRSKAVLHKRCYGPVFGSGHDIQIYSVTEAFQNKCYKGSFETGIFSDRFERKVFELKDYEVFQIISLAH
jgi:hypothetical protein